MKEIKREITLPEGFEFSLDENIVTIKGNGKEIKKELPLKNKKIEIKKEGNKILIQCTKKPTRRETAISGSIEGHIKNMIRGLERPFVYKLECCNAHFPMVPKVEGNKLLIKNFLGEKVDRVVDIIPNVEVKVKGNIIEVSSIDKEAAGQMAANIEIKTKIKNRDRRVFQDGIFIIEKDGEEI